MSRHYSYINNDVQYTPQDRVLPCCLIDEAIRQFFRELEGGE